MREFARVGFNEGDGDMRVSTPVGVAVVSTAMVIGGATAYVQTLGGADVAQGAASASSSASPSTPVATSPSPSGTASAPASPDSPSASSTPSSSSAPSPTPTSAPGAGPSAGARLALGAGRVGPVSLPASGDAAAKALTPILGAPYTDRVTDECSEGGQSGKRRELWWGDGLRVFGETGAGDNVTGWSVTGSQTPVPVDLPYGIAIGTKLPVVEAKLPNAKSGESNYGAKTLSQAGVVWYFGNGKGQDAEVTRVSVGLDECPL